jgi:hypothetical protein
LKPAAVANSRTVVIDKGMAKGTIDLAFLDDSVTNVTPWWTLVLRTSTCTDVVSVFSSRAGGVPTAASQHTLLQGFIHNASHD